MRVQFNVRLPQRTRRMIEDLANEAGCTHSDVIIAAVEVLYDRDKKETDMEFYDNVNDLKSCLRFHDDAEPVWSGEDGSYAVGVDFPADVEEGEVEYIRDGIVADWKQD